MDFITLVLIAIGLSFDTFAVSISLGLKIPLIKFGQAIRIALIFALFQALMPFIGWLVGRQVAYLIVNFDHWVAFGLLLILGLKMIFESIKNEKEERNLESVNNMILMSMALATSMDALVVGVSFAFINIDILQSLWVIGIATFLFSMVGMLFGKKAGNRFGNKMEIVGGLILIGIGLKILLSHLYS